MGQVKYRRIAVVGTCGSGKTTLAAELARRMGAPHIELDALHWGPNWSLPTLDAFRRKTEAAIVGDAWTVDGNYSAVRDIVWSRADTVVWLNYALPIIYRNLLVRTLRRVWTREILWNGNYETLRDVFGRESLFWYALPSTRKHRRRYPLLFCDPQWSHLHTVILHSPHETQKWLPSVTLCERLHDEYR